MLRKAFGFAFIPHKTNVFGSMMYLHKSGHSFELAFEGGYELLETAFLKNLNLKGKIVIDVGACVGYYTLLAAKLVGDKGRVIAFEPEKDNFRLLKKNITANETKNIFGFQAAVGDVYGYAYLKIASSPGQHSISQSKDAVKVPMVSLDKFLEKNKIAYKNIGYVKIDAEGYEHKVLQGMLKTIKSADDMVIQFEYAPQHLEEQGCNFDELFSLIVENNLKAYYWDFSINKLLECKDARWFLEENVIDDFKNGVLYSRNIILSKKALKSHLVAQELVVPPNQDVQVGGGSFIKPSPYLDFLIPKESKIEFPRSGKYFVEFLKKINFKGKKVLDIGTGYFGFLARHAKKFGANKVVAVDLNFEAIENASESTNDDVEFKVSDVYEVIEEKFDVIISNPPQLPESFGGKMHDVAGKDGMLVIEKIIDDFDKHVSKGGKMYMLLFDFLLKKTQDICNKNGLDAQVVAYYNKSLRKGGETEKRKDVIESMYGYKFKSKNNELYHRIYILEIE